MMIRERLLTELRDPETRVIYAESLLDSTIATQIKTIREQRGWTQAELAQRAGMRQSRISAMEDVNYASWNVNTLKRLAAAFECALEVRFVPFARVLDWASTLSNRALQVPRFEEDGAFSETAEASRESSITAQDVRLNTMRIRTYQLRMSLPSAFDTLTSTGATETQYGETART